MEPDNVLIRCPNGHELQAARSDMGKMLCCPVCNTTFASTAPTTGAVPGAIPPATIEYAGYGAPAGWTRTVQRPGYADTLIGLWIAVEVLGVIASVISWTAGMDPQRVSPLMIGVGCVGMPMFVAAVVLQLMWIYKIHRDALAARNYGEIAPGLALGLSFIPCFNYIWTGLTMKKLAGFAAGGDRSLDPLAVQAVRATNLCFYFGVLKGALSFIGGAVGLVMALRAAAMQGQAAYVAEPAGVSFLALSVLTTLVNLSSVGVYAWAVKRLQASLYAFLGAPD
jgi:hypothetical protein